MTMDQDIKSDYNKKIKQKNRGPRRSRERLGRLQEMMDGRKRGWADMGRCRPYIIADEGGSPRTAKFLNCYHGRIEEWSGERARPRNLQAPSRRTIRTPPQTFLAALESSHVAMRSFRRSNITCSNATVDRAHDASSGFQTPRRGSIKRPAASPLLPICLFPEPPPPPPPNYFLLSPTTHSAMAKTATGERVRLSSALSLFR